MNSPFFSIVTVTLNNMEGLRKTYKSVREQSFSDFEWVVVDGNSIDGTQKFLAEFLAENLRWISGTDTGLYDAMNKGIEMSSGHYLIFMNAGDEIANTKVLDSIFDKIRLNNDPDFIYGDSIQRLSTGSEVLKQAFSYKRIWYGMFTHHQAILYSKKVVDAFNLRYRLDYKIAADYAFTAEFLIKSAKILYLKEPVCVFQGGGITSKSVNHLKGMLEQWKVGREILKRSIFQCLYVFLLHVGKHIIIRLFPGFYSYLRYNESHSNEF